MLKRFIEIEGDIVFDRNNASAWELMLNVKRQDVPQLLMEMLLLGYKHSQILTIKSKTTATIVVVRIFERAHETAINMIDEKFKIDLSPRDCEVIVSFLLQYYRDSYAPVDHIHISIDKSSNPGSNGDLTIIAEDSAEPISGDEARKILRGK